MKYVAILSFLSLARFASEPVPVQESVAPAEVFEQPDIADTLGTRDQAEIPVEMEMVFSGTTQGAGIFVTLVGKDSEAYAALNRKLQNRRFHELKKTRTLNMTAEQNEAENIRLLAACVRSWRSRLYRRVDGKLVPSDQFSPTYKLKGEQLECNIKNVERVLTESPEAREQIEDFIDQRQNFLKGSSPTSSSSPA